MGSGRLDGLGQAGRGQARPGQVALGQAAGPGQTGPGQAGPGRRYKLARAPLSLINGAVILLIKLRVLKVKFVMKKHKTC